MKSQTGVYFESKVRLEKTTEDGMLAKFVDMYVVNAQSFTECEAKVTEHVGSFAEGEYEILTEAKAQYKEIFFSDKDGEDIFFKAKVDFITIDEKTCKQKHSKVVYLVQASSMESAQKNIEEVMNGTMIDYRVVSINELNIVDYVA